MASLRRFGVRGEKGRQGRVRRYRRLFRIMGYGKGRLLRQLVVIIRAWRAVILTIDEGYSTRRPEDQIVHEVKRAKA